MQPSARGEGALSDGRAEPRASAAPRLQEFLGPAGALVVFVHADCPTSRLALRRLEGAWKAYAGRGLRFVAVHQDPLFIAEQTMKAEGASYEMAADAPDHRLSHVLGVDIVPHVFLLNGRGERVGEQVGWSRERFQDLAAEGARLAGVDRPYVFPEEGPAWKPGCSSRHVEEAVGMPAQASFDELEDLFERGWTDGLPVVPPTRWRVQRMLGDLDPAASLGRVPPSHGELTLERLAACAVMAGCHPSYFAVVVAVARAALRPEYNLHGHTVTTHGCGPVIIVNGPVRQELGINGQINALGGFARANATIGRALRLMTVLTGRGQPGVLDRATQGQPGKIGFCFAEWEEASPWEPLQVERGFDAGTSTVTLLATEAPMGMGDHVSADAEALAWSFAQAMVAQFSPVDFGLTTEPVVVVCPEHAATFGQAGWSKRRLREWLFEHATTELLAPALRERLGAEAAPKWRSPEQIVIVVAGGDAGRFSSLLAPWRGEWQSVTERC